MGERIIYSGCGCEITEHFPDFCPNCRIAELEEELRDNMFLVAGVKQLEARMILAMRLNYANYPGYVTTALHGKDIPEEVLEWTDKICIAEEYAPTLGGT